MGDTLQGFEQAVTWDASPSGPAQRADMSVDSHRPVMGYEHGQGHG